MGRKVPGGILIRDAVAHDALSHRLVLGSFFERIAADVAAIAAGGVRVLEVGCGPGRLSIRLARQYGFDLTGLDLDPAMIERARANAHRRGDGDERRPSFLMGDVASLAFPDGSFDLVVSTLSMHTGLTRRRAWQRSAAYSAKAAGRSCGTSGPASCGSTDILPDPVEHTQGSSLRVVGATPWRWPWRFNLAQRSSWSAPMARPGTRQRSSRSTSPSAGSPKSRGIRG
jgi:SAM-dependent methyltransferase